MHLWTLLVGLIAVSACSSESSKAVDGLGIDSERYVDMASVDNVRTVPDMIADASETFADTVVTALPCPVFVDGAEVGKVEHVMLTEISGLAASRTWSGVLWAHNDSGDVANLYALTTAGEHLGIYQLQIDNPLDCEAMSLGPGPEGKSELLYLADIGDNLLYRKTILVHRVSEPTVNLVSENEFALVESVTTLEFVYGDGQAHDAEAYFVDPLTDHHFIVEKVGDTTSIVFRAVVADGSTSGVFEPVATVPVGLVTAADITVDGGMVMVKSYFENYLWVRQTGESLVETFMRAPCPVPIILEPQGEAIAFAPDGAGYYTVSEGASQPIYYYGLTD